MPRRPCRICDDVSYLLPWQSIAEPGAVAEIALIVDLVVVAAAALVGGAAARLLRQPTMVGYILAGIAVGPYTPGPIGDVARVRTLAKVGVILLMFTIGVELSLARLAVVRDVAVYGGVLQIVLTAAVGAVLGGWLGLPLPAALEFGRHVFHRYGLSGPEIQALLSERRSRLTARE